MRIRRDSIKNHPITCLSSTDKSNKQKRDVEDGKKKELIDMNQKLDKVIAYIEDKREREVSKVEGERADALFQEDSQLVWLDE